MTINTFTLVFRFYRQHYYFFFFFFNDTATTEIYTLSLHDALPTLPGSDVRRAELELERCGHAIQRVELRSEEHTSELQSQSNLVCRLLLEKKKKNPYHISTQLL